MSTPHSLPDITDKKALRAWLAANRSDSTAKPAPRTLVELRSAQLRKLASSLRSGTEAETSEPSDHPVLRFSLDGEPVDAHKIESAVLGEWLRALQNAVQSVAYALNDLRPPRESGPVPKDIQRVTKLFSGALFASSYGMVLEGAPEHGQSELPGTGVADVLLDRAINRIFDVTDRASSVGSAEDAVLDAALPLGRRAISHLSDLSDVLASSGANVTLMWQSKATSHRTSSLSAENAARCHKALRAAQLEDREEHLIATVVGGSKLRGAIEIEVGGDLIVVSTAKESVTGLLAAHAERQVEIDVHVLTARSPGGRVHHSYSLLEISPHGTVE
ncbi:hypothetical protein [Streptomyces alboflavus]|uniref:hypothetical protein n=1 Tax=Streptomyces alboflavus TaxID=67267 RepID=UPI000F6583D4|nr:hypothetical protein [Streptomyces alboflavus]